MRIAVLTSLPRPVVLPEDFLPRYLDRAGIPVTTIVARRVPLLRVLHAQARTDHGVSRSLAAIGGALRSRLSAIARPPASRHPANPSRRIPIKYVDDHNSPSCTALLHSLKPDLLVLGGGTGIIRQHILDIPRIGTLGCHYGLLPRFRGVNVTEWAIFHDEPVGVSIFWVTPGVDVGDVVLQRPIAVMPGDTLARLRRKSADEGKALLLEAIRMLMSGMAPHIAQRVEDGRQYFTMHSRLMRLVERKLAENNYALLCGSRPTEDDLTARK